MYLERLNKMLYFLQKSEGGYIYEKITNIYGKSLNIYWKKPDYNFEVFEGTSSSIENPLIVYELKDWNRMLIENYINTDSFYILVENNFLGFCYMYPEHKQKAIEILGEEPVLKFQEDMENFKNKLISTMSSLLKKPKLEIVK